MEHFEKLNYHHESYMYVQFVLSSVYQLILLTAVKKNVEALMCTLEVYSKFFVDLFKLVMNTAVITIIFLCPGYSTVLAHVIVFVSTISSSCYWKEI